MEADNIRQGNATVDMELIKIECLDLMMKVGGHCLFRA